MNKDDELRRDKDAPEDSDSTANDAETHATTGGAAAAGAVTGGIVGLAGGPAGAAVGAVGGAIVGAAAERIMHRDDDAERAQKGLDDDRDANLAIENRGRGEVGAQTDTEGRTLPLREEEVHARKSSAETGEVRLGKEVVTEERKVDVPVTREEVVIDRKAVERRPSDTPIGESERASIDVPVREEQVRVEKQPVVYEEVGVGKREVQEKRNVDATVRREELRLDREGDARVVGWDEAMPRYRSQWQQRVASRGGRWEEAEPAYRYGWELRNQPTYRGRSWRDAESDIQSDWSTRHPDKPWDRARESVRDAWESATD